MLAAVLVIVASYAIGSIPVAYLAGRASGADLRSVGSGNVGASNVGEVISRRLMILVGMAQIAQGLSGVLLARAANQGSAVQVASGLAVIAAHNWNPWLHFRGGRGVGSYIGVLLGLAPFDALVAFVLVSVLGVPFRASAQSVLAGMLVAPVGALLGGESRAVVIGCALAAAMVMLKRLLANGPPETHAGNVWLNRLLFDRDVRERAAWVRRGTGGAPAPHTSVTDP